MTWLFERVFSRTSNKVEDEILTKIRKQMISNLRIHRLREQAIHDVGFPVGQRIRIGVAEHIHFNAFITRNEWDT